MTNTIAELWNGNLNPICALGMHNEELKKLEDLLHRNREKVEENFNEKYKEILEKYNDCIDEYIIVICEQAFCDGFCVGTRIAVEAINGAEKIMQNTL